MTERESQALAFIEKFQAEHGGVSPSVRDIARGLSLKSTSSAARLIDGLERRRVIVRLKNRWRAISIGFDDVRKVLVALEKQKAPDLPGSRPSNWFASCLSGLES